MFEVNMGNTASCICGCVFIVCCMMTWGEPDLIDGIVGWLMK